MKKIIFVLLAVVATATIFAQSPLEFTVSKHNFGKIKQGVPVTFSFPFKNTSNGVVVIENATAECGCTTPEYPKAPIAKGATKEIKVTYNAQAMGTFTKKVTVNIANQKEPVILLIEGEVVDAKAAAAKPTATKKPVAAKKS